MCETQDIRYVHHMEHPDYHESLAVGCVCAEHMENDYEGPRRREKALRNAAQRKRRWLSRKWKVSAKGNAYLNTHGLNITVFQRNPKLWGARIEDRATGRSVSSRRPHQTEDAAKLAAFDAMIFLKRSAVGGRDGATVPQKLGQQSGHEGPNDDEGKAFLFGRACSLARPFCGETPQRPL